MAERVRGGHGYVERTDDEQDRPRADETAGRAQGIEARTRSPSSWGPRQGDVGCPDEHRKSNEADEGIRTLDLRHGKATL
jgi:hypothetical protein